MLASVRPRSALVFALGALFAGVAPARADGSDIGRIGVKPGGGRVSITSDAIVRKAPECAPLFKSAIGAGTVGATSINIWEAAKAPALQAHCERLARAVDHLHDAQFAAAVADSQHAESLTPGQPGPLVVRAEALARWGKPDEAVKLFEQARLLAPRALDDAETLDDFGAVLIRLRRLDEARLAFRALLPRVSGAAGLCGARAECDAAGLAYWSAGLLAFDGGTTTIDAAVAMLREARARSEPARELRRIAGLTLALALDRRGDVDQAREVVAEIVALRGVPADLPSEIAARLPWPEEATAVRALALEASDPAGAAAAWKAYLAAGGDKRVWGPHARTHAVALEKATKSAPKPR